MNNLILVLLLILSLSHMARAVEIEDYSSSVSSRISGVSQTPTSQSIVSRIIPQMGFVMSDLQGADNSSGLTPNYSLGVTADIGRGQLVFETGLLYRQLGAKFENDGYNITFHSGYLGVPLFGKYYFSEKGNTAYFKAGFIPSYLESKYFTSNVPGYSNDSSYTPISYFEFEAAVGVGDKIPLGRNNELLLELTWNRGYTNILSDSSLTLFNEAFILTAGIAFDL